jgi:UDP-glucose 4-epimerase
MRKKPVALVTGATGVIGPLLITKLLLNGYHVKALIKTSAKKDVLPAGVQCIFGDITDINCLKAAVKDTDYIFHLAALLHVNNPGAELRNEYNRINVKGTKFLVTAAQAETVKRMVYFSTINVYGPNTTNLICDEKSPLNPSDWYAESKVEAERIVLDGINSVVLRPAAVYGSRMKGNYRKMLQALRKGIFIPIGPGENRRAIIFEDDIVTAAVLAAEHPRASGNIYNVSDGENYPLKRIIANMCQALDRGEPKLKLPLSLAKVATSLIEYSSRVAGKQPPVNQALLNKLLEDTAVSSDEIINQLKFYPVFKDLKGWQETVKRIYGVY